VIVDEAHAFTRIQRVQSAEYGCMAKSLGDTACVEGVDTVLAKMQMGIYGFGP